MTNPVPPHGVSKQPPFRADHVGSFLRPAKLLAARERRKSGVIEADALRAIEDEAIRDVVQFQEDLGLRGITDGEFRRTYFHIDFLTRLTGVETKGGINVSFHSAAGNVDFAPPVMQVTGPVRHDQPIQRADFEFLRTVTTRTPKVTIPSPTMLHFRGGRGAISRDAYPDLEDFYADVAQAYRDEISDLAAAGCTYLQLDDTNLAYLCDQKMRGRWRARRRAAAGRRSQRAAAALREAHQRGDRGAAGEHDRVRPSVPGQLQECVGRGRRLRACGGSPVQRARG